MKVRRTFLAALVVGTAVGMPLRQAHAGAGYTCTFTNDTGHNDLATTTLTKPDGADKIVIAPSKKKGDGGSTIQLVTKDINCGSACNNNVVDLGVRALGNDIPHTAGILFNVSGGKAAFPSNGKNKISLGSLFGPIGQLTFNQSLGIGLVELREPASDPTACNTVPLAGGNKCTDGKVYAVCGFKVPVDPSATCAVDADCKLITAVCDTSTTPHLCKTQTCPGGTDDECNSGHCNINAGTCCSPDVGTGCP
ncbi:MAG TPA: hypothetical protein VMW56_02795 [Candidatus Margulisiibacteriota bacterium]|nr:hypothetical protein [Candidatus Margulisiibacteriota bacterium]